MNIFNVPHASKNVRIEINLKYLLSGLVNESMSKTKLSFSRRHPKVLWLKAQALGHKSLPTKPEMIPVRHLIIPPTPTHRYRHIHAHCSKRSAVMFESPCPTADRLQNDFSLFPVHCRIQLCWVWGVLQTRAGGEEGPHPLLQHHLQDTYVQFCCALLSRSTDQSRGKFAMYTDQLNWD